MATKTTAATRYTKTERSILNLLKNGCVIVHTTSVNREGFAEWDEVTHELLIAKRGEYGEMVKIRNITPRMFYGLLNERPTSPIECTKVVHSPDTRSTICRHYSLTPTPTPTPEDKPKLSPLASAAYTLMLEEGFTIPYHNWDNIVLCSPSGSYTREQITQQLFYSLKERNLITEIRLPSGSSEWRATAAVFTYHTPITAASGNLLTPLCTRHAAARQKFEGSAACKPYYKTELTFEPCADCLAEMEYTF